MNKIEKLKEIINNSKMVVFFGGAGVSTASGIPDFRSANGLYNEKGYIVRPEEILSHHFFLSNTKDFYEFYRTKMVYKDAKPNYAHKYLAKLEEEGKLLAVITQNIDNLHQMAGSKNVLELHGTIYKNHCMNCHKFYSLDELLNKKDYKCDCGGLIKPDVVLYEEPLDDTVIYKAVKAIASCDTLIIGGTSLSVYPAASFINYFNGKNLIIINMSSTNKDNEADLVINEDISKVFEQLF